MSITQAQPTRTTYVESGKTAWQQISAFAGETITNKTRRVGRFYNDPINPYYKEGFLLKSGEVLVIQHSRILGDMKAVIFANVQAQRAYEEVLDTMVADPETGRR